MCLNCAFAHSCLCTGGRTGESVCEGAYAGVDLRPSDYTYYCWVTDIRSQVWHGPLEETLEASRRHRRG